MQLKLRSGAALFLGLCTTTFLQAQPGIDWDKSLGGNGSEAFQSIELTSDGGYIIGGFSTSGIDGDKSQASKGSMDYWLVKLAADGTKQWDKSYGGDAWDALNSVKQTADGGYILGGLSYSQAGGDKTENNHPPGETDYWVVKVSADGTKEWDRTIGSDFFDDLRTVVQTADGGYLLAGSSESSREGGDKTDVHYGGDYWVVKLSPAGVKLWDKSYGGRDAESLRTLKATSDGGFIAGGISISDDSWDKTEDSRGGTDYWITKADGNGIKQWDKTIGGSGSDLLNDIQQTGDGGYILGGQSSSGVSGEKSEEKRGVSDYWVVKLNSDGIIEWDKTIGGSSYTQNGEVKGTSSLNSIQVAPDGGYILAGDSDAGVNDEKTQANVGAKDIWLVKLSATGAILWDKIIGGTDIDFYPTLRRLSDGGYILGAQSDSDAGGDKSAASKGGRDFWIVKLTPETALPVVLADFSVVAENQTAAIAWATTSETRASHFEIQHSGDGKNWNLLTTIGASADGAMPGSYHYTHAAPVHGDNFYRLKMVDNDNTFTFSKIERVRFDFALEVSVYPNPAAEWIHLQSASWTDVRHIQLINQQGKQVYHSGPNPSCDINAKLLAVGSYFVKVTRRDGSAITRRIVIGR